MEYYGSFNIRVFNSIAGGSITFLFERVSIHHYPFKTSCINNSYPNVTDTDYTNQVYLTDYTPIANFLSAVRCFGGYSPTNSIELDEQTMLVADQIRLCLNAVDNIGWVYDTAFPITNVTTLPNAYRLLALFNGKPSDFNSFGSESWINYYTQIRHRPGGLLATEVPSPINYGKLADVRYDRVLVLAGDYPWRSPKLYRRVFFLHYNVGALDEYFLRYR
jgi:hypothetical protein